MSAPLGRPPFPTRTTDDIFNEVEVVEHHVHTREHWLGISADQSGDNWGSDTLFPFAVQSGVADYTTAGKAKVLGTDDTPYVAGNIYFDLDRILVTAVSEDSVYKLRIIWGTGLMVDAITANQFTCVMIMFDALNPQQSAGIPLDIIMPRLAVGTKVWAQVKNVTNLATLSFYIGLHEYTE